MASTATPELESLTKSLEELSTARSSPPERYIVKDGIGGPDFPVMDVPVIDLALLSASSPEELDKLGLALSSSGYIQVINHGAEEWFLEEFVRITKEFFSLPLEEKLNCVRSKDDTDGYGNDPVVSNKQTIDWSLRLNLMIEPESKRKLSVWPTNPPDFRKMTMEFANKMKVVHEKILKALAKYLKLEDEECFLKQYGENQLVVTRFNFYPPCYRTNAVLGAKPHGDASAMTYLLPENLEGLQTLIDGQWYKVRTIPNAIVVNIGDQTEIMSNGIFKSPFHRVVTNPHKERVSIGVFFGPDPIAEIGPIQGLIDEKRPRMFKNLVDYLANYFQISQTGERPIDYLRI